MKPAPDQKLLDRARAILRRKHYAYNTEQRYLAWIRRFILFHGKRHPIHMGRLEIEAFLTHLAVKDKVAAATQNQALNAILFLYRTVLDRPIEFPLDSVRARRPKRIPTVLSREEVASLLPCLSEPYRLIGKLLYGSGLRVSEAVRMRVKDIDFEQQHLVVRDGKLAQAITTEAHFKGIANMMTLPLEEAQYRVGKAHGIARVAGYPLTFSIEPE